MWSCARCPCAGMAGRCAWSPRRGGTGRRPCWTIHGASSLPGWSRNRGPRSRSPDPLQALPDTHTDRRSRREGVKAGRRGEPAAAVSRPAEHTRNLDDPAARAARTAPGEASFVACGDEATGNVSRTVSGSGVTGTAFTITADKPVFGCRHLGAATLPSMQTLDAPRQGLLADGPGTWRHHAAPRVRHSRDTELRDLPERRRGGPAGPGPRRLRRDSIGPGAEHHRRLPGSGHQQRRAGARPRAERTGAEPRPGQRRRRYRTPARRRLRLLTSSEGSLRPRLVPAAEMLRVPGTRLGDVDRQLSPRMSPTSTTMVAN